MQILDGKLVAGIIKEEIKKNIIETSGTHKKIPHLAAILVGNNAASETYVNSKVKSCFEVGIISSLYRHDENVKEESLLQQIYELNKNDDVDGILVQLPLPSHISEQNIINAIAPSKDVDGFTPENVGNLVLGNPTFISATPHGITLLLQYYNIDADGKHIVIVGRSNIVGTPLSILYSRNAEWANATVTLCHSRTKDLASFCRQADILIAAVGRPGKITADMVKENAVVVDVGINRIHDLSQRKGYRIVGDVDFENVAPKCSFITPVPGGVGPMTIAALLKNTCKACEIKNFIPY